MSKGDTMSALKTTKTSIEVFRSKAIRLCNILTAYYSAKALSGDKDSYATLTLLDGFENTFRDPDSSRESMSVAYANVCAYAANMVRETSSDEAMALWKKLYTRDSLKRQLKRAKRKLEKVGFEAELTMAEFPTARELMEAYKDSIRKLEELLAQ